MAFRFNEFLFNRLPAPRRSDRVFLGLLEAWISIAGNILLFLFKFLAGARLHSVSLQADAIHSLSDVLTSVVVIIGFRIASKPADDSHPYGHGRFEHIATLVIALLLCFTAWELGQSSFRRILNPSPVLRSLPVVILLGFSVLFKELMASFSFFLGAKTNSATLRADAWHHRSDAITTILVIIGLVVSPLGFPRLDGILGTGIAFFIVWIAFSLIRSSVNDLMGKAPDKDCLRRIYSDATCVKGVLSCHDVAVHDYQNRKEISLHIEVASGLSAAEAHCIARNVEDRVRGASGDGVTVHIDPRDGHED